jgi:hypothetical protein
MYDGFNDKGAHSAEWFEIVKNFLKLAFLMTVVKQSARAIGVGIEGCCLSMRYPVTLLSTDLCQTIWCDTNIERCRQPHPLSRTKVMMKTE